MAVRFWTTVRVLACSLVPAAALILPVAQASADVLTVFAVGRIDPVCEIGVASPLPPANFANWGYLQGTAAVNCNTGFKVRATSANGAVKNSAEVTTGFTNTLPYNLRLVMPVGGGTNALADCASAELVAGQSSCPLSPNGPGLDSGGTVATSRPIIIYVSWKTPRSPRLIAGDYHDTIIVSVEATP